MHPVILSVGPLVLFSYSVLLVVAWCTFSFLFWRNLKDEGIDDERIFNTTFYATVIAFIAARVLYVIQHWGNFSSNLLRIAALWVAPGLAFYGGLIAGIGTILFMARSEKIRTGIVMHAFAAALPVAGIFGALGALLDGTVIGKSTMLPWGVSYIGHIGSRHPVELYDMIFYLALGVGIYVLSHKMSRQRVREGTIATWFFIIFAVGEFLLEFLKESSVYWAHLTLNQWILLGIFSESVGVLYVKAGGNAWLGQSLHTALVSIGRGVRNSYAALIKIRYRRSSKKT